MVFSLVKMSVIVIEFFHLVAFGHKYVYVIILPAGSRQVLEEEQCILELHLLKFFCELEEESSDNVAVELREAFFFREVCVP